MAQHRLCCLKISSQFKCDRLSGFSCFEKKCLSSPVGWEFSLFFCNSQKISERKRLADVWVYFERDHCAHEVWETGSRVILIVVTIYIMNKLKRLPVIAASCKQQKTRPYPLWRPLICVYWNQTAIFYL